MKTIKLTRTIRRELPNGVLVYIGPDGVTFREKRSRRVFPVTWLQVYWKAMNVAFADEQRKTQPLVEVKPIADDLKQVLMFSDFHTEGSSEMFDEGINCEDPPACNQENSPLSRDDQR